MNRWSTKNESQATKMGSSQQAGIWATNIWLSRTQIQLAITISLSLSHIYIYIYMCILLYIHHSMKTLPKIYPIISRWPTFRSIFRLYAKQQWLEDWWFQSEGHPFFFRFIKWDAETYMVLGQNVRSRFKDDGMMMVVAFHLQYVSSIFGHIPFN